MVGAVVCARAYSASYVRYNFDEASGYFEYDSAELWLKARFKDVGANAQVLIKLQRLDVDDGSITTILTLDSNSFTGSSSFQVRTSNNYCSPSAFSLDEGGASGYHYYVEVLLSNLTANDDAACFTIGHIYPVECFPL
jgi:hypothetical protein